MQVKMIPIRKEDIPVPKNAGRTSQWRDMLNDFMATGLESIELDFGTRIPLAREHAMSIQIGCARIAKELEIPVKVSRRDNRIFFTRVGSVIIPPSYDVDANIDIESD